MAPPALRSIEIPDEIQRALRVPEPERMDESSGRAMASNLNIRITGTLGVLLKAKRDGQIPSLKSETDRLVRDAGFFVSTIQSWLAMLLQL